MFMAKTLPKSAILSNDYLIQKSIYCTGPRELDSLPFRGMSSSLDYKVGFPFGCSPAGSMTLSFLSTKGPASTEGTEDALSTG